MAGLPGTAGSMGACMKKLVLPVLVLAFVSPLFPQKG
jgi:nitrate/nitrite transporter NarK